MDVQQIVLLNALSIVREFDQETELNLWRPTSTTEDILTDSDDENYFRMMRNQKDIQLQSLLEKQSIRVNYLSAKQANF